MSVLATFATPPLFVTHEYDGSLQAEISLDLPLWANRATENRTVQMLALSTQLEFVSRRIQIMNVKGDSGQGPAALQHEIELSKKLDGAVLKHSGESLKLCPRLLSRLSVGPIPPLDKRTAYEAYLLHLTHINQTIVLALQLRGDVQSTASHKYCAHQLALLYQSLSQLAPHLDNFTQEIERQFSAVKASARGRDGVARLPKELRNWLLGLTSRLLQEIAQLPDALVAPMDPVLACLDPQ